MPVHSQYRDHLENDICREAAVGLGAGLVAHVPVRGVGEVLGLVHLVHLRVLALQPAEVVVVVGVARGGSGSERGITMLDPAQQQECRLHTH